MGNPLIVLVFLLLTGWLKSAHAFDLKIEADSAQFLRALDPQRNALFLTIIYVLSGLVVVFLGWSAYYILSKRKEQTIVGEEDTATCNRIEHTDSQAHRASKKDIHISEQTSHPSKSDREAQ